MYILEPRKVLGSRELTLQMTSPLIFTISIKHFLLTWFLKDLVLKTKQASVLCTAQMIF